MFRAIVLVLFMGSVAHGAEPAFVIEGDITVQQSDSYNCRFSAGGSGYISALIPSDAGHSFLISADSSLEAQQLTTELIGGAPVTTFSLNNASTQIPVGVDLSGYSISGYLISTYEVVDVGGAPSTFSFLVYGIGQPVPEPSSLSLLLGLGCLVFRSRFRR